jgi:hypothetical protein
MGLDPLEKDRLRRRMALRMQAFAEGDTKVTCISGHYYDEPAYCELAEERKDSELLVVRNRSGKTMRVSLSSLKEMLRFQVIDVDELEKWVEKLKVLRTEAHKRKDLQNAALEEQRRKLEKKVIVRKAKPDSARQNSR